MTLNVFLHPRQAVRDSLAKPSLGLIVALNLLPAVLGLILLLVSGLSLRLDSFIFEVIDSVIKILVLSGLIYLAGMLVNGREAVKGRFLGLVQAVSLAWLVLAVMIIVSTLFFWSVPGLNVAVQELDKGLISTSTFAEKVTNALAGVEGFPLTGGLFMVVSAVLGLYVFLLWFFALEESLRLTRLKSIGVFVVLMVIMYYIMVAKDLILFGI